jgi:hypothetical protein
MAELPTSYGIAINTLQENTSGPRYRLHSPLKLLSIMVESTLHALPSHFQRRSSGWLPSIRSPCALKCAIAADSGATTRRPIRVFAATSASSRPVDRPEMESYGFFDKFMC